MSPVTEMFFWLTRRAPARSIRQHKDDCNAQGKRFGRRNAAPSQRTRVSQRSQCEEGLTAREAFHPNSDQRHRKSGRESLREPMKEPHTVPRPLFGNREAIPLTFQQKITRSGNRKQYSEHRTFRRPLQVGGWPLPSPGQAAGRLPPALLSLHGASLHSPPPFRRSPSCSPGSP